jgi:hypothetical protein
LNTKEALLEKLRAKITALQGLYHSQEIWAISGTWPGRFEKEGVPQHVLLKFVVNIEDVS